MAKNNIVETPTVNTIGKGTSIKGDVKSNGDFRIDGELKGSIRSDGKIVIGATGSVEGEINCQNADISGSVKANITVKELLSLKSSCDVNGEIITNKLAIEPGARFSGTCSMDNQEKPKDNTSSSNEQGKQQKDQQEQKQKIFG
jgi:cytoskeletal protein CcmA (bactofilin family)